MTIKIPKSLYDQIKSELEGRIRRYDEASISDRMQFMGPYGIYAIESVPDEEYTEEVIEPVKRYKQT